MNWKAYSIVTAAVVIVGLALGVTLPLVSLRLHDWGYSTFAIGIMAGMPAVGIVLGSKLSGRMAGRWGSENTLRLVMAGSAVSVAMLAIWPSYPVWLLLRLVLGISLTVTFIIGESWINQLVPDRLRGRLVAVYGSAFALSQLCGPLLLGLIGTLDDRGFWLATGLLITGVVMLFCVNGAPVVDPAAAAGRGLRQFIRTMPAIAWAMVLFAGFETMTLTLLPVYLIREGFAQQLALIMVSTVVVGDAVLQVPIGWLADKFSRTALFKCCGVILLLSSLAMPLVLHTVLIWPVLVLFGSSAGGLYTLSIILVGQRFRDDALVRANAHIAMLWGLGCLLGPVATGAASEWLNTHALPMMMAIAELIFVLLAWRRGAFAAVAVPAAESVVTQP